MNANLNASGALFKTSKRVIVKTAKKAAGK